MSGFVNSEKILEQECESQAADKKNNKIKVCSYLGLLLIIQSFIQYLFNAYYIPGTILDTGDRAVNKIQKSLPSRTLHSNEGRQTIKQMRKTYSSLQDSKCRREE